MSTKRLLSMDPSSYSVSDVCDWLDLVGFGQAAGEFRKNGIDGMSLLDLEDSDLVNLGIGRLGPRKQLLRKIENLKKQNESAWTSAVEAHSSTSSESGSHSSAGSASSGRPQQLSSKMSLKVSYEGEISVVKIKRTERFSSLQKKLQKALGVDVNLFYMDDGDEIAIKDRKAWKAFFTDHAATSNSLKVIARIAAESSSNQATTVVPGAVKSVYEAMGDAVFLIDRDGRILFLNKPAEKLFQWTPKEAIGQNIKIVMSQKDADSHDFYLHRYFRDTDHPRIVGKGSRLVIAVAKDRSDVPVNLSVTALKSEDGKPYFAGVMTPAVKMDDGSDPSAKYGVLNALLSPAIVIDTDGDIVFCNRAVTDQLGYEAIDLLGENVNCIMPEPHRTQHDNYLRNYLTTGEAKVIGSKRKLEALHKDGRKLPILLTVTQMGRGDQRTFTGVMEVLEEEVLAGADFVEKQAKKVEKLMVPAVLMDGNGIVRSVNSAFSKMVGYGPQEVVGQNVKMLMPENIAVKHDALLRAFAKNPEKESTVVGKGRQVTVMHKDSTLFVAYLAVKRFADSDGLMFFLGTFQPQ